MKSTELVGAIQAAVNSVSFDDMREGQKKEYAKAGARRVILVINEALDKVDPSAAPILSEVETDKAIEALKRGESVSFRLTSGPGV